jgi:hypothetical protein
MALTVGCINPSRRCQTLWTYCWESTASVGLLQAIDKQRQATTAKLGATRRNILFEIIVKVFGLRKYRRSNAEGEGRQPGLGSRKQSEANLVHNTPMNQDARVE